MIKRRTLLKALAQSSALPLFGTPLLSKALITNGYSGPLLLQIQAEGGWDVTSYCDPKVNQPGEKVITNWSKSAEPLTAGGIAYAPFGNNETFFERHHKKMLVINGIDTQTNSHTTGVLHNWSGRNAEGFPSLPALFAAHHSPESAMPYVNFGGFGCRPLVSQIWGAGRHFQLFWVQTVNFGDLGCRPSYESQPREELGGRSARDVPTSGLIGNG